MPDSGGRICFGKAAIEQRRPPRVGGRDRQFTGANTAGERLEQRE
jgi:hypothetical protein